MHFYQQCPADHGYPRFVLRPFWTPTGIPFRIAPTPFPPPRTAWASFRTSSSSNCAANGIRRFLAAARSMGDYLVNESLTPEAGIYPAFTRSTGKRERFPLPADAGSQGDRPFEIEPDKGGIAGYALVLLFEAAGERRYLEQGLHNARVLAANQSSGDASQSPWPFRADYRSGQGRGEVSGNMTYILRLYDWLLSRGYEEFAAPRQSLWKWIKRYQIPSAAGDGALFAQFFEDHETPTNRTAWAPLNLARYLLEKRDLLDRRVARRLRDADRLRAQATSRIVEFGVTVCHEQDEDKQAWGGVVSTYGAVLALYAKAIGSPSLGERGAAGARFHALFDR